MGWIRAFALSALLALSAAACSSSGEDTPVPQDEPTASTSTETSTTASPPPTTTPETTSALQPTAEYGCEQFGAKALQCKDIEYHEDSVGTWTMTAYLPSDGEGPWPLAVVYHGMGTNPADSQARRLAELGFVAMAPRWLGDDINDISPEDYIDGYLFDRAACATGMAQAIAADLGADPERTTVIGFSAGVHPAGWAGLGVGRDLSACPEAITYQPTGMVLGDTQVIFQHDRWDDALSDARSVSADTLDRFINPARWDLPNGFRAYLWTTESAAESRPIDADDPWSWLRARDTGTLTDDLTSLGCLDDGVVSFLDSALLLEHRINGLDRDDVIVVTESLPGDHSYKPEVYARIAEVMAGVFDGSASPTDEG